MNQTKLPEGWERGREGACWNRRDGSTVWANRNRRYSAVVAGLTISESIKALIERDDAVSAMLALNAAYPLKGEG